MLKPYLNRLFNGQSLSESDASQAMGCILDGADPCQTAAFLALMKFRGETAAEAAGMIKAIETTSKRVEIPFPVVDIVGTGGDQANTVNLSTGSAILAAACGIPIAKHGNRSVSSKSGSADVLEALGIKVEMDPCSVKECLEETNIAFMYAPFYHPSIGKVGAIRRSLKIPTVFNLLGPLLNPAHAPFALIGVAHEANMDLMSDVVIHLNRVKRGLVFHGNGLDELSPIGPITACHINNGRKEKIVIDPAQLGLKPCSLKDLQGGDAKLNAALLLETFSGQAGPLADALILNAGAAIFIFGKVNTLAEGIVLARETLMRREALRVLERWKAFCNRGKQEIKMGESHATP